VAQLDPFGLVDDTVSCSRDEKYDHVYHIADDVDDGLDVSVEMQMRWAMSNISSSARSETTNAWKHRQNGVSQQRPLEPVPTRFAHLTHDEGPRLVNVTALIRAAFVISHHANASLSDAMRAKSKQWLRVSEVFLASAAVDHVAALPRVDRGWGCGFRNIMMICSALRRTPALSQVLLTECIQPCYFCVFTLFVARRSPLVLIISEFVCGRAGRTGISARVAVRLDRH
jgi:hypothetical protein